MGSVLHPPACALIEPCPAPVILVSGVGSVTEIAGGLVCVTLFQEIPSDTVEASPLGIERHVAARLIWPRSLLIPSMCKLFALLQDSPTATEIPNYVPHH